MSMRFERTQRALQDECVSLLQQYRNLEAELKEKDEEVKDVNAKLLKSERRLMEMTTYVRSLKGEIFGQERELSNLSPPRKKQEGTEEEAAGGPAKHLRLDLSDRLGQAILNNSKFGNRYKMPKPGSESAKLFNAGQINEYLNKHKFNFYGSQIIVQAEDKVKALENELIRDYHIRLEEAESEKHAALEEHRLIKIYFNQLKELSDFRQEQILALKKENARVTEQHRKDIEYWKSKFDIDTDILKTQYENQLNLCKKIFSCEVEVLSQVVRLQQEDVIKNRVMMKQIATLLRVPRAHHKYVDTYGAFDFIEKCNEIIEYNDTRRAKQDALEDRAA